jgi:hypothetical protein
MTPEQKADELIDKFQAINPFHPEEDYIDNALVLVNIFLSEPRLDAEFWVEVKRVLTSRKSSPQPSDDDEEIDPDVYKNDQEYQKLMLGL